MTLAEARPGHAPGWKWRKDYAGQLDQPLGDDVPTRVGGLCELGYHGDCPQAPCLVAPAVGGCSCECHQGSA